MPAHMMTPGLSIQQFKTVQPIELIVVACISAYSPHEECLCKLSVMCTCTYVLVLYVHIFTFIVYNYICVYMLGYTGSAFIK